MAKRKLSDIQIQDKPKYYICAKCGKKQKINEFYSHCNKPMGVLPVCKTCMYETVLDVNGVNRQGMIALMKYLDMPFIQNEYDECINKYPNSPKRAVAMYVSMKMMKNNYIDLHFKDSIFDTYVDLDVAEEIIDLSGCSDNDIDTPEQQAKQRQTKAKRLNELKEKWGNFDSIEYLERCEKLYVEIVQGGYIILSAMHARTDAKLNPNQFKAADFQNSGANSFGEITRMVAKRDGFIPLPMKYFKQPNDQLDWLMLELVNYDRSVLGLPEVTYDELYKYYIERIEKFNKEHNADIENGDLGDLDLDTKGKKKKYTLI